MYVSSNITFHRSSRFAWHFLNGQNLWPCFYLVLPNASCDSSLQSAAAYICIRWAAYQIQVSSSDTWSDTSSAEGPPVLQHCGETSFYKILHKTWIATPLTCQYLIQKIPLMSFLCWRSGFYLCRIFNEGAWSLWLWHIQLTRHRTHSEQYTKHSYRHTIHFTRTLQLLHELIILLPDHLYF